MKFAILTDTHFVPSGIRLYGLDPAPRLRVAVDTINAAHPDIAFVIISGDLAHWGETVAYESLRTEISRFNAPVILMMGNHDKRAPFRAQFPGADRDDAGFVQAVHRFEAATVITLDTLNEDAPDHAGLLCEARLAFLEDALRSAPADRPVLLFQHHPPFDTGLRYMDGIKLANGDDEWAVFERTRKPDQMFMGHVHRPIAGTWRGVPFHIQRALIHQVAFDLDSEGHIPGSHEPPDYGFVHLDRGNVIIHQCPFLYDGPRFSLHDPAAQRAQSIGELRAAIGETA